MTRIRKVAWLHVVDRRLLCARSHGKALYYVPGGKPEADEDDITAVIREIREELAVALIPGSIADAGRVEAPADGRDDATVVIRLFTARHAGDPAPHQEIAELRYLAAADADSASAATRIILSRLQADNVID
jgi:8-oxo-dGTP pyrophosphatase MutT (NUDIX family)